MKILCQNCGYEFETRDVTFHNIMECPKCGAPYVGDGLGLMWL